MGIVLGGNCPRWELSWVGIVLYGNYPGGNHPDGNCPGGNCPSTTFLCYEIFDPFATNMELHVISAHWDFSHLPDT